MNAEKTGKVIHDLRIEKGFTQQGLADALSVSPTTISKWENGHSLPDISMLEPLAEILDVSISEIVIGEVTKEPAIPQEDIPATEETATMNTITADTAIKSVIKESLIQRRRKVITSVLLAAIILSVLFGGCYYIFFHGFPAEQNGIITTTAVGHSDNGDIWTIRLESENEHHLLVTSEYGDDTADVILKVYESPAGRSAHHSFTWGYDGGNPDPDFKVKVIYKGTEVIYSMAEEGLYGE